MRKKVHFNQINLLLAVILLVVCGKTFAQTEIQIKKPVDSETLFENVFKTLTAEPKWLFEGFVCPLDIFPTVETKLNYSKKRCAENPETCLNNCKNSDGNSCYTLALLVQDKKGLDQDYSEALFQRACKLGIISGCTNRAANIFGLEDEKTIACAAKTFEKTCEKNDTWGCAMYGLALSLGRGIQKDNDKALEVLPKACKNGEEHEACQAAKQLIEKIKESKTKK